LLTDRCSDKRQEKMKKKINDLKDFPSGRSALLVYLFIFLLSTYGFSNAIPWSSEAGTVLYYNAPSSWVLGFENIKGLYKAIKEFNVENSIKNLIEEASLQYNLDRKLLESFFNSRIIIITDEENSFDFQDFLSYLFDSEGFLNSFFQVYENNVICIEQFEGLETLMNVLSDFKISSRPVGEFVAFSGNERYLEEQFQHILNRNEFSKDVIFYSESRQENIEVTNAYSFLNFEKKEMISDRQNLIESGENSQFLLNNIYIPFKFDSPTYFEINSANHLKDYFYDYFEVHSSINEWLSVFELLKMSTLYTFFFSDELKWMLGFNCSKALMEDDQWKRYISSWGLNSKEQIKPFADEYYLSLYDTFFIISNFELQKIDTNNQVIADIMTKFERNMLLTAEVLDQNYHPDVSSLKIYHFSYIDDKIKKDLFRVF